MPDIEARSTDIQDYYAQEHINGCDQCRRARDGKPVGFGQKSGMCEQYFAIIRAWADGKMLDSTT